MTFDVNTNKESFIIGMPHLSAVGLSEHWLLKECGHEHWMAIAQAFGQEKPEFRDRENRKVYAAFICINIENGKLDQVVENDEIDIVSTLIRLSSARNMSTHMVMKKDQVIARVHMVSTFVHRQTAGNNQSVVKAEMMALAIQDNDKASTLMAEHKVQRSLTHQSMGEYQYLPCPYSEFNGADFLYFAAFQSIADRAERYLVPDTGLWSTISRSIYYYGNSNIDDVITVQLIGHKIFGSFMMSHLRMVRSSDGKVIADIHTEKESVTHEAMIWRQKVMTEGA